MSNSREGAKKKNNISADEIFNFREEGKSYVEIENIYTGRGIKVSRGTLKARYVEACNKKGKKPVDLRRIENEEQVKERIYELKSQGKSLREITKIFRSEGNNIAIRTVNDYWRIICNEKGITDEIDSKVKERIYELRKSGLSYDDLYKKLREENVIVPYNKLIKICKEIFIEKGEKEPNPNRGQRSWKKNKIGKDDLNSTNAKKEKMEEIFNLRQLGNSYRKIHRIFKDKGRKISPITIKKYCKIIYEEKGLEEPQNGKKNEITDEEIYNLRKKGYSYNAISKSFEDKGITISSVTISVRCKEIFRAKGEKEPVSVYCVVDVDGQKTIKYGKAGDFGGRKSKDTQSDISDDEIFERREEGMTLDSMIDDFAKSGRIISRDILGKRTREIYRSKGMKYPKLKKKKRSKKEKVKKEDEKVKEIKDKIHKMRREGVTLQKILDTLKGEGIDISYYKVWKVCKDEFGVGFNWKKEKMGNAIYELRQKGYSYNKIKDSLEEQGISVNYSEVRDMCKKIYEEKGEIEPILKGGRKKLNKPSNNIKEKNKQDLENEIFRLRKEGKTFKEIAKECQGKGYKCSVSKAEYVCKRVFKEKREEVPKAKSKKGIKTINVTGKIEEQSSNGESLNELKTELKRKLEEKIASEKLLAQYELIDNKGEKNADKADRKIIGQEERDTYEEGKKIEIEGEKTH